MKTTKIISTLFILMAMTAINGFVADISAQTPLPKCRAEADQIYFVESGQSVTEVRPGGSGYQLNILGTGADKFTLIKEPYMTSVSLVANYTSETQAKWQIYFNPRMGQVISSVRMQSRCTGRLVHNYRLTESVTLTDEE